MDDPTHKTKKRSTAASTYSLQEQERYCTAWSASGLTKVAFCREHNIPKSALPYWLKKHKIKKQAVMQQFSPLMAAPPPQSEAPGVVRMEIRLPNHSMLFIALEEGRLVPLIKELCGAAAAIR